VCAFSHSIYEVKHSKEIIFICMFMACRNIEWLTSKFGIFWSTMNLKLMYLLVQREP